MRSDNTEGTLDKTKWAYLAALIDGEGCFNISRHFNAAPTRYSYMREITVTNTDRKMMRWLYVNFGGSIKVGPLRNPTKHKRRLAWKPSGTENLKLIVTTILPYLVSKREQADVFLEFLQEDRAMSPLLLTARLERKEKLRLRIRELNAKGPVETDTQDSREARLKIQSELMSDYESALAGTRVA